MKYIIGIVMGLMLMVQGYMWEAMSEQNKIIKEKLDSIIEVIE